MRSASPTGGGQLVAGIDAGGTAFKLAVAEPSGPLLGRARVPTTQPDETIDAAIDGLGRLADAAGGRITRVGIASFGPVVVDPNDARYGTIQRTVKPGWTGVPMLGRIAGALGVPGALDTDVNAALEAEADRGAAKGTERAAYVTVGTGIGVSVSLNGRFAGRPHHPELGHIPVRRSPVDTAFAGCCPVHGDCLEGLAAGPSLSARYGRLEDLRPEDEAWHVSAWYLAQLTVLLSLGFRLERIVLGGGVLNAPGLVERVREQHAGLMAGYLDEPSDLIVRAALGDEAGVTGACLVAMRG